MRSQTYLIDTNVVIGLEDNHAVEPDILRFLVSLLNMILVYTSMKQQKMT